MLSTALPWGLPGLCARVAVLLSAALRTHHPSDRFGRSGGRGGGLPPPSPVVGSRSNTSVLREFEAEMVVHKQRVDSATENL